jgi:hypothetical protein
VCSDLNLSYISGNTWYHNRWSITMTSSKNVSFLKVYLRVFPHPASNVGPALAQTWLPTLPWNVPTLSTTNPLQRRRNFKPVETHACVGAWFIDSYWHAWFIFAKHELVIRYTYKFLCVYV